MGSVLYWAFPMTSSHEKTELDAQKLPPSLTLEEIHNVWIDTAKPARVVRINPKKSRPRSLESDGNRSSKGFDRELLNGKTNKNPINVGIT